MELRPTNLGTGQPLTRGETGDTSGCQVRYVNLIMERAREKESKRYVSLFISFFIFVFQMGRSQMCRASKSRESIQGPCLAVPSGKPIGLRIFMQCQRSIASSAPPRPTSSTISKRPQRPLHQRPACSSAFRGLNKFRDPQTRLCTFQCAFWHSLLQ